MTMMLLNRRATGFTVKFGSTIWRSICGQPSHGLIRNKHFQQKKFALNVDLEKSSCRFSLTTRSHDSGLADDNDTTTITTFVQEERRNLQSYATEYHAPVMARECIDALLGCQRNRDKEKKEGLIFVDGTLGGGGHTQALLEKLSVGDVVIGLDVDPEALSTASIRLSKYLPSTHPLHEASSQELPMFIPVQTNFADATKALANVMPTYNIQGTQVDGILLDLGVSSHQIDCSERGFAFQKDGPLDMRMNCGLGDRSLGLTAADICNEYSESDLARIFRTYSDESRARVIAKSIVEHRPLTTTFDLVEAVAKVTPQFNKKSRRGGRIATCARIFQALRIVVNREDEVLKQAFDHMAPKLVRPGGRLVVLSYLSMEDRMTKRIMRDGSMDKRNSISMEKDIYGNVIGPTKPWALVCKLQKATEEEISLNSRARSATLRVAERLQQEE